MDARRILTIDGGGIKGVFAASFLTAIETELNRPIVEYFDLIVGTSTGGIIALGLGLGFRCQDILAFYEESGPRVFRSNALLGPLRWVVLPRYSAEPLREVLQERFGDKLLGESQTRLVIPALDRQTGDVHIYKTAHDPHYVRDYKTPAVDVALATAAAPTYFPAHQLDTGTPLIDGGVWANNPTGVAVVEAIGVLRWPRDGLQILSVGCTTSPVASRFGRWSGGLFGWAPRLTDFFLAAQSSASMGTAYVLTSHEQVHRVSPVVAKDRFALDRVAEIADLKGLGYSEARKQLRHLETPFFTQPAEKFEPCRAL